MKRLLLVDDNIQFLELLSGVLNGHFHIYKATGVQEALRVIETAAVDAVCSDFNMRDGTGLELLEQLRSKGVQGVYEIISGHRRKYASQKLGYTKLPVIIRVMTDEEAIIAMIDSNLQREKISHSEKAYAYMMKNEALKRKVGRKRSQSGHRLKGKKTVELISEASGDSPKQVQHLLLLICRNISMICRRIRKMTDQYAIYRVNLLTERKNLWQKSFEQVRKEHLPVRIDLYRQIHISFSEKDESVMEIWKKTRNITEVSDVLVLNHSGEISCYYVNEDAPRRITGFIRLNPSGTLVTLDTRDYKIEGYEGNWMAADDMIIDGRQFFLMEHQEFHRQAAMIVLDSYGRKVVEECKEGFNQEVKDKIYSFLQSMKRNDIRTKSKNSGWSSGRNSLKTDIMKEQGIRPNTIRLSIGTEHIDDIIEDLETAFQSIK